MQLFQFREKHSLISYSQTLAFFKAMNEKLIRKTQMVNEYVKK